MLTEEMKQQILNGAYAVTRDGAKIMYIGRKEGGNLNYPLLFASYDKNGMYEKILSYTDELNYYRFETDTCETGFYDKDIVGLWKDEPEPFNLERALAGEPIRYNRSKYYVIGESKSVPESKDMYVIERYDGVIWVTVKVSLEELTKEATIWKEPEQVKLDSVYLPKPIKEVGDLKEVWFIYQDYFSDKYIPMCASKPNANQDWQKCIKVKLENKCLYATFEECKTVCDWLMGRYGK